MNTKWLPDFRYALYAHYWEYSRTVLLLGLLKLISLFKYYTDINVYFCGSIWMRSRCGLGVSCLTEERVKVTVVCARVHMCVMQALLGHGVQCPRLWEGGLQCPLCPLPPLRHVSQQRYTRTHTHRQYAV